MMKNVVRPRLAPEVTWRAVGAEGLLLMTESEGMLSLKGSIWPRLLPLLDGTRTARELADSLNNPADAFELYRALFLLKGRDLVEDGRAPEDPARRFWRAPEGAAPSVCIKGLGGAGSDLIHEILRLASIGVEEKSPIEVVIAPDYRDESLRDINRRHINSRAPWLLIKPDGWRPWIGPAFTPGNGPCWDCLASRLRVNQMELAYAEQINETGNGFTGTQSTPATRMAAAFAAPILERLCLTGDAGDLANTVWTLDLKTMAWERHHVVRRPQCPECGDTGLAGGRTDFELTPRAKEIGNDGGYRSASPWLTYERYRRHVSPISGAVSELQPGILDDNPFHLFASGANRATPIRNTRDLLAFSLRGRSGGKGATREQAVAGALAEALERYSCAYRGDARAIRARLADLAPDAIDPRVILGYSEAQYAARREINARGERCYAVPEPFDPSIEAEWTPVRSLTSGTIRYVPTALCWFGHPASFAWADSNGCAAGNNLEEAILQGLCELIERDATAAWWYNRIPRPGINLDTLGDPWCASMIRMFREKYGREVAAIDLTHDIGIPVAAVVCALKDAERPEYFFGLGCHLDASIAVRRAFSEMCQFFGSLTAWAGETQGKFAAVCRNMDPGMARWLSIATIENQPQMTPLQTQRSVSDLPSWSGSTLLEDIQYALARLRAVNVEALALDCTQPDIGMPVARVFAPGLRHFWARFAPGRLYDVPVSLGWRKEPSREEDLNPVAMFF